MPAILSLPALQTALEVGAIYSLVAMALFISFSILNIADLSTDGCYTLGFAVGATVTLAGHPLLALPAAMLASVMSLPATFINGTVSIVGAVLLYVPLKAALIKARFGHLLA